MNKIPLVFFICVFAYTISLFIAPLTLEPGTVRDLDGNANMIDYQERWDDLPPYHAAIYIFSDFNCHQRYYRSYSLHGNQMPVCARDVGVFLGLSLGSVIMIFIRKRRDYRDTIFEILPFEQQMPDKKKNYVLFILGALVVLPIGVDGGLQLVTSYESVNPLRTITGLIFGFGFSVFILALLVSSMYDLKYR